VASGATGRRCFCGAPPGGSLAENVAESLTRGSRVILSGRLKQRSFETREGEKRSVIEVEVDEIGPSLRYATTKVTKQNGRGKTASSGSRAASPGQAADDPWSSAPPAGPFAGGDDGPPF
jgi:single-strand DNA-binding protein